MSPFPELIEPVAVDKPAAQTAVAVATTQAIDLLKIDLTDVALAQFGPWKTDLAAAQKRLANVAWDVSTAKGLKDIADVRHKVTRQPRFDAQNVSKALKSKLSTVSKAVGALEEAIAAGYKALEDPLTAIIDKREAEIKAAAEAEKARIQKHRDAIATIRGYADDARAKQPTAEKLALGILFVDGIDVSAAAREEFAEEADIAKVATLAVLVNMHTKALDSEAAAAEQERLRLENIRVAEELAEQKRQIDAQRAELARQAAEVEEKRIAAAKPESDRLAAIAREAAESAAAAQRETAAREETARLEAAALAEAERVVALGPQADEQAIEPVGQPAAEPLPVHDFRAPSPSLPSVKAGVISPTRIEINAILDRLAEVDLKRVLNFMASRFEAVASH